MPKAARGLSPSFPLRPSSATECPPPLSDEGLLQWFQRITMGVGTGPRREERHCADADGDHRFNDDEEPRSRQKHEEAAYDDNCRLSRETFRRWRRGAHCSLQVEDRTLRPHSRFDPCPRSCSFVPEICSSKPCENGAHRAMLPISGQSDGSPSWRTSRKSRWPCCPRNYRGLCNAGGKNGADGGRYDYRASPDPVLPFARRPEPSGEDGRIAVAR